MKVEEGAIDQVDFDQIPTQISSFESIVEVVGAVQRLMDISHNMKEVPGHPCPFEGDSLLIGFQDWFTPVYGVDCIHILLERTHALESVVRIINSS